MARLVRGKSDEYFQVFPRMQTGHYSTVQWSGNEKLTGSQPETSDGCIEEMSLTLSELDNSLDVIGQNSFANINSRPDRRKISK